MRVFLLTGILTCGETGLPLVGKADHGSSGTIHRYYHYPRKPKDLKQVRPRLSADELEEKVLNEFKSALKTQRYFDDFARILKTQAEANGKGSAAEFDRVQKELKATTERISAIWSNQSRMQLNEEALRLTSDELNRLAKQKQELEKYLSQLDPKAVDPQTYQDSCAGRSRKSWPLARNSTSRFGRAPKSAKNRIRRPMESGPKAPRISWPSGGVRLRWGIVICRSEVQEVENGRG